MYYTTNNHCYDLCRTVGEVFAKTIDDHRSVQYKISAYLRQIGQHPPGGIEEYIVFDHTTFNMMIGNPFY